MSRRPEFPFESVEKLNEVKFEICRILDYEMTYTQRTQQQLALRLGTSQANISRVMNRKVNELTFNQLFRYLAILRPSFKILIAPR